MSMAKRLFLMGEQTKYEHDTAMLIHSSQTSQQWMYPCGGMPMSTNRSLWPVSGGAVALQPGWFQGKSSSDHIARYA